MEQNSFPIDIGYELKEFDNNVEFLKSLIDEFLEQVEQRISVMEKAVADKDTEILKREAHAIKGGAANLTANDLSKAAWDLEDICKSGVLNKSSESVEKIKKEFFRLKEYVKNHDSLTL